MTYAVSNGDSFYMKYALRKDSTKVIPGLTNSTKVIRRLQSNATTRLSLCLNASGPSIPMTADSYKTGLVEARQRGVELRLLTEVTRENIQHCKEMMKIADVRHIDGIRGNFIVTEGEYIASTVLEERTFLPRIIYSNVKEMVEHQQYVFETLSNKAISASQRMKEIEENEKTDVIYGKENVVNAIVRWQYNSEKSWNLCVGSAIPSFSMSSRIKKGYRDAKARGVKIRYATEITKDNIEYCKEIMDFGEVRHLEGLIGNFVVSEKEYLGEASAKEFLSHLIYSNRKEIVDQQNYIFENLWNNGVSAEGKIKSIKEGTIPFETRLIEDPADIAAKIRTEILNSREIIACSQPGPLQLIYNNFFDMYKQILDKQRKGQHKGIRLIVTIDKYVLALVKHFVQAGVQVRHVKNILPLSFVVTDKEVQANLEDVKGRKMIQSLLTSNEPIYVKQFASVFEQLWNDGIDARLRMKDIDEGNDNDIEVIQNPAKALERCINGLNTAEEEVLLIFPTNNAVVRQQKLGIIENLRDITEEGRVRARILMPSSPSGDLAVADRIKRTNKNIDIRYIGTNSGSATVLVVDKKISVVMELKDDSKDNFFEAIGLSTYSNSKPGILSYVTLFESLWAQTDLMTQLQVNDRMQKEFINVAAHELRTPIQPILSLSEHLRSDIRTDEGREMLDIVIRNAERLQQVAEDILDVTRIEGQSFHLNIEKFNLEELLYGIIADRKEEIKRTGRDIKISYISDNKDFFVEADKTRLAQVVSNLLNNAIRFTSNGTITLTKQLKKGNEIVVSVIDSGTGIHPEIMSRLFSKFATKSTTGTGLGLFISKSIVQAHGGEIMAENNVEQKGATFRFTLPVITRSIHER